MSVNTQKQTKRHVIIIIFITCISFITLILYRETIENLFETVIMDFIQHFIYIIVILVGFIGLLCVVRSLWRICQEKDELKNVGLSQVRNQTNLKDCFQKIEKKEGLLYQRIDIILKSYEISYKGDNSNVILPSLKALHEISVHKEFSRLDSASVKSILSFLLILGILGTLTGVHVFLRTDIRSGLNMKELAEALLPSAWAVFFTVVLMFFRSLYICKVQDYIKLLDELTMSRILPSLSTKSSINSKMPDALKVSLVNNQYTDFEFKDNKDFQNQINSIKEELQDIKKRLQNVPQVDFTSQWEETNLEIDIEISEKGATARASVE